MRIIRFDQHDEKGTSIQAQAWQVLWLSVVNYPSGNKEQTFVGNSVFRGLRGISIPVMARDEKGREIDTGQRRLDPKGGELYYDDAEFRLLGQAVDKFRENINIGASDALIWIDNVLEKAPTVSRKDYLAKTKKLKLEPAGVDG